MFEKKAKRDPQTWAKNHDLHSRPRTDDGEAFLHDPGSGPARMRDPMAESLGEEYVASAISGEEAAFRDRDETAPEEVGGPFLQESIPEGLEKLEEILEVGQKAKA